MSFYVKAWVCGFICLIRSYTYLSHKNFSKTQQRFPTEDHLMIHRHKHEMTLKFPSIKNDNMLSGELRLHQYRLAHYLSRVHGGLVVHLQVCVWVTHAQAHLSIIRKLHGASIPVVCSNVNHMTHCSSAPSSAYRWHCRRWRMAGEISMLRYISPSCCFVWSSEVTLVSILLERRWKVIFFRWWCVRYKSQVASW